VRHPPTLVFAGEPQPDEIGRGDSLAERGIALSLVGQVYGPADPMGKMFFNILATFAEFEGDLLRMRTREGMAVARAKGQVLREAAQTLAHTAGRVAARARQR
jgi:DNA invertase Pin-like site-specific DNA recombinase